MPSSSSFRSSADIQTFVKRMTGFNTELHAAIADLTAEAAGVLTSGRHPAGSELPLTLVCNLSPGRSDPSAVQDLVVRGARVFSVDTLEGAILAIGVTEQAVIFSGGAWKTPACETDVNVVYNDSEAYREIVKIVEEHIRTAEQLPPLAPVV